MPVTFNILGDCVSRDILQADVKEGVAEVKRYVSFIHPVSLVSPPWKTGDLEEITAALDKGTHFGRRNVALDITSSGLDYLFEEQSDYLVLDFLECRRNLMVDKAGHVITRSGVMRDNFSLIRNMLDADWTRVDFDTIPEGKLFTAIRQICEAVLNHYSPDRVIINKHFGAEQYILQSTKIRSFNKSVVADVRKYNEIAETLFAYAISLLPGCHVINFPDYVLGTKKHKWGIYPLHYSDSYYKYGRNAINEIVKCQQNCEEKLDRHKLQIEKRYQNLRYTLEIRENEAKHTKMRRYYDVCDSLVKGGNALIEALDNVGAKTIALYADLLIAGAVKSFLEQKGYTVGYMVSAWDNGTCEKTYSPNNKEYPPVDALVICDVMTDSKVKETMGSFFPAVFSAFELLGRK